MFGYALAREILCNDAILEWSEPESNP